MSREGVKSILIDIKNQISNLKELEKDTGRKSKESIELIIKIYKDLDTTLNQIVTDIYEIKIKNHDSKGKNRKVVFPYCDDKKKFKNVVNSSLPNLHKIDVELYQIIESVQPYICRNRWLFNLCDQNKQIRDREKYNIKNQKQATSKTVSGTIGTNIFHNVTFVNKKPDKPIITVKRDPIESTFIIPEFHNIEVISFLNECRKKIIVLYKQVYPLLR